MRTMINNNVDKCPFRCRVLRTRGVRGESRARTRGWQGAKAMPAGTTGRARRGHCGGRRGGQRARDAAYLGVVGVGWNYFDNVQSRDKKLKKHAVPGVIIPRHLRSQLAPKRK